MIWNSENYDVSNKPLRFGNVRRCCHQPSAASWPSMERTVILTGLPVNYLYLDGKIYFHCAKAGHKLDAVRANDKVCFTVLSEPVKNPGEWWNCFTSVICFGRISEVTDEPEKDRLLRQIGAKYFPEGYDLEGDMAKNARNALILEISIDHISGKHVREK